MKKVLAVAALMFACAHSGTAMAGNQPNMEAALVHLKEARAELEKAVPNKGGHREKAIELVDKAIKQTEEGINWSNEHK